MTPFSAALLSLGFLWLAELPQAAEGPLDQAPFVEKDFPFFSSVLDARKLGPGWPQNNLTPRGLILNLGHGCWACFDTDLLRMSALWAGNGVTPVSMSQGSYHTSGAKAPEGQEKLPTLVGAAWLASGLFPGWQTSDEVSSTDPREAGPDPKETGRGPLPRTLGRFKSVQLDGTDSSLEYEVDGVRIVERVEARSEAGKPRIQRRFLLQPFSKPLWLLLGERPSESAVPGRPGLEFDIEASNEEGNPHPVRLTQTPEGFAVHVAASSKPLELRVAMGFGPNVKTWAKPLKAKISGTLWTQTLQPKATLIEESPATGNPAYAIDALPIPILNPWGRHVRAADLGFFPDGRAAVVTFDGDVWLVTGLSGPPAEARWRRFASGLHEPLSLAVRGEAIFVFDRNGIWRLWDKDGNGEADTHELISNAFGQTAETREYANSMKLVPDGSFIIAKGGQQASSLGKHNGSVLRISPDGASVEVLGYGLRQPFIGVHPITGLITASDQQGHYIPATPLHIIQNGQFYGFLSHLLPKERYPAEIAEPLTWIPHAINPSGATQVWLVGARMGDINDALIHFGYYRPEIFLVRTRQRGPRPQASVVSLTRALPFPPLNGAVNPVDGQLYVVGFQIWGTEARQISGLARVRHTGLPSRLPREVVAMDKGILLRFDVPLQRQAALDPENYSAERWNYLRTANYGSPHFNLDGSKGQESLTPTSAALSKDGKSVFVGFRDMRPVMQMRAGWSLTTASGDRFEQNAYLTPRDLPRFSPAQEGFDPFEVVLTARDTKTGQRPTPQTIAEGKRLSELMGCVACHSTDGSTLGKVGPSWKGLFGRERTLATGVKLLADEAYVRESIKEPSVKVVAGFDKSDTGMPSYEGVLTDPQIDALTLYIRSIQ